ncbi:hypothetical protein J5Y09_10080 [Roseomonas sp. PWR1]|uniref:histidine kinase n=1 Tax=Roseomonas nitratireducens TaxID=2820810 RepID=A0ABS4AU14_9PROT|nr:ATP-binding protein [Neoroseomonas nitratireducens]MBP0464261.1 hypothetical protein [Neoroseomonas nitratireducens]
MSIASRLSLLTPRTRGFDVLHWFAVLTLLCIIVFGVGTATFLSGFLTRQMLQHDTELSAQYLDSIMVADRIRTYFADPTAAESREPLEYFFNHVANLPNVVRANVFASDGSVLWSSNAAMIGRRFAGNPHLDDALAGRLVIETGTAGKAEHEDLDASVGTRRFVEAYIPVWDDDRRHVIGVVEVYRLPDTLFQWLDRTISLVWIAAFLMAALLYASLLWIGLRARRIISEQQRVIVESESLAAIGAVASAVAHGIRNPLASIRSSAELAATEDAEGAAACLADIEREADRMDAWVRDLLLQARREPLAKEPVDVNQLIEDCTRTFAARAARQGVTVATDLAAVPAVRGEPAALGQAIENLLANAIEAMPEGGDLRLHTGLVAGGREIEVIIADTGVGLPAGNKAGNLFYSTKARGTGLGLLLTRRIVERHEGRLTLSPRRGGGTSAVIRLPAAA